jgi:hypothetical protein
MKRKRHQELRDMTSRQLLALVWLHSTEPDRAKKMTQEELEFIHDIAAERSEHEGDRKASLLHKAISALLY